MCGNSSLTGNPFATDTNIFSAPCRVKVWKIDQFITNTAGSGGGGKTTLFEGAAAPNAIITLSQGIDRFDVVKLISSGFIGSIRHYFETDINVDSISLNPNNRFNVGSFYETNTNRFAVWVDFTTTTSVRCIMNLGTDWTDGQVNKVIGINY